MQPCSGRWSGRGLDALKERGDQDLGDRVRSGIIDRVRRMDSHVSGWVPDFRPAQFQLERHRIRLRSLLGDSIVDTWAVWRLEDDEWFAHLPVVLVMKGGEQLEICWEKFDDLSITWNTIDPTVPPKSLGGLGP